MYKQVEKSKENNSKAITNSVVQKKISAKQNLGIVDKRAETIVQRKLQNLPSNNVLQMGGGSWYWRRQNGGPWILSGKMGNHQAATKWHVDRGFTNGNGWQFSQGGKKNPPGT